MIKEPLVYIILLNYNGWRDTIECIESLNKIKYKNFEIIVVDNNSTDNSREKLLEYAKINNYIFLESESNNGFAAGNNLGVKFALKNNPEYILLLNNDTIVEPEFLTELIACAKKNNNVGIIGGKIYNYPEMNNLWYAGGYINKLTARGKHKIEDYDKECETDFITGCMQLINIIALKDVGLMDEQYFLYYEDLDYCMKFKNKGYKLVYTPNSIIYHKCGGSASYVSATSIYYSNRARWIFVSKNFKGIVRNYYKFEIIIELLIKRILYKNEKKEAIKNVIKYIFRRGKV